MHLILSGITFWEELTNASVNNFRIGGGGVNCLSNRVLKILIAYLIRDCKLLPNFYLSRLSGENFIQQNTNWKTEVIL